MAQLWTPALPEIKPVEMLVEKFKLIFSFALHYLRAYVTTIERVQTSPEFHPKTETEAKWNFAVLSDLSVEMGNPEIETIFEYVIDTFRITTQAADENFDRKS